MRKLDDQITVRGEITTLRRLAAEGQLVLRKSGDYTPDGAPRGREALWADITVPFPEPHHHGVEISEADYAELLKMGVRKAPSC